MLVCIYGSCLRKGGIFVMERYTVLVVDDDNSIVELLKEICAQGSAILMITHNLNLLTEYPGKVYRFANHHIEEVTNSNGSIE